MRFVTHMLMAVALALAVGGCFLPVPYNEPGSPIVVGQYRGRDGAPAAGARMVVTDGDDAAACTRPLAVVATDSAGNFRLPATTVRRRGVLLVPPVERFSNRYALCASAPSVADSSLHVAYNGSVSLRSRGLEVDSVSCLDWTFEGDARVTCTGSDDVTTVQAVGAWQDGDATGFYRLIVLPIPWRKRGSIDVAHESGAFLQWVERATSGAPEPVRATVALPLVPRARDIDAATMQLTRTGATCVRVQSTGRATHWFAWRLPSADTSFVLGAPGQMRPVPNCVRDSASR